MFLGDFNFGDPAEGRWSVRRRVAVHTQEPEAAVFDDLFPEFADVAQPASTRRQFREGQAARELDAISRIDRVWVNAPTAFLLGRGASAWVEESAFSDRMLSDHVGLGSRWSPPCASRRQAIPRWVAADPKFPLTVDAMIKEAEVDAEVDAFTRLAGVTACIHRAAKQVALASRVSAEAAAPEWQAEWLAVARSACLRRCRRDFADAVARAPAYAHLFGSSQLRIVSDAAFADSLQGLLHGRFAADQRHDLRVAADDFERRAARRRYGGLLAAWSPKNRVVTRMVILSEAGEVIRDDAEAASALEAHWGRAFSSSGGLNAGAMAGLRDFVASASCGMEAASLGDLRHVLARAPRSAPGPDGIAYEHWANAGETAARILHEAYLSVLAGAPPSAGLQRWDVGVDPEGGIASGASGAQSLAERLAPAHLGQYLPQGGHVASQRDVGEVRVGLGASIEPQISPRRGLLVNVAELDGAITGFLQDDESEPAAVLLDIAAAFPSAAWEYIRWALTAQGAPPALISALFAMYGPTVVEIYLNGKPSGHRMPVTCGIRQGCPASGTVWALLYDPIVRFLWGVASAG